nr:PREDICTED: podocalyxin-like isoform X1 [Latimeria chalumnae]|eukprot:XP_005993686.1 PREDICTED: podocalyxin-like isoform X1 [Latimeria chalumnae]
MFVFLVANDKQLEKIVNNSREKLKELGITMHHANKSTGENVNDAADAAFRKLLIAGLLCGAVLLCGVIAGTVYTYCRLKSKRKGHQCLTEELQRVENGYHDNPTLEVTEKQEMQEKAGGPNGELNDSWIVPLEHVNKGEREEEDTHL